MSQLGCPYTLLEHATEKASRLLWAVLESRGGSVSVQATHSNSKESSAG